MNRKEYKEPVMKVVKMQRRAHLLQESVGLQNYRRNNEVTE